ncbi:MAG: hypothetical protein J6I37_05770 [Prevotella sp.]|nr:hypothetical protein [Prevotella sp.]
MKVSFTTISNYLNDKTEVKDFLTSKTIKGFFFQNLRLVVNTTEIMMTADSWLCDFLRTLRPELKMVVETEYIDKVYRDSYYSFFSTKLKGYNRNCLRISFFEPVFNSKEEFFDLSNEVLQDTYRGFLVVRPLAKCIGRNAIDVRAKIPPYQGVEIRKADIVSTCLGVKLKVKAFPHASQDTEYMTCAETTVWAMMEYYGIKYPIHQPVLPSDILSSIQSTSFERQTPSKGLRLEQISLALQRQGFGCKIYQSNGNPRFQELFTCYVESGLPLAVVVEGAWGKHAVVCIGRPPIDKGKFTSLSKAINMEYCFWNKCVNDFVFNDDNRPCYQICSFQDSTPYFGKSVISHFIVPLHKKIYLPAEQAIDKSNFFVENDFMAPAGSIVRTFLTSSRTYREYLKNNVDFPRMVKEAYLTIELPKFIWVTEVTFNKNDFVNNKVNALIILDATGMTTVDDVYSSLIMKQNVNCLTIYDKNERLFKNLILTLPSSFNSFNGNLR